MSSSSLNAFNLLDNLEFRSAASSSAAPTTKSPQKPAAWRLGLDCHHQPVLREDQIHVVSRELNAATGEEDIKIVCPKCARNERGSCDKTAIHKVVDLTPMYARHVKDSS